MHKSSCDSYLGSTDYKEMPLLQVDLKPFIKKDECEVLNECDAHTLDDIFEDNDNYMESSCDNQVILYVFFRIRFAVTFVQQCRKRKFVKPYF